MKSVILALFLAVVSSTRVEGQLYIADEEDFSYLLQEVIEEPPVEYTNTQYGDVTVTISNATSKEDIVPDRYSGDGDDKLMNNLIAKGYAFSKSKAAGMHVEINCGCNCNCCLKPTNATKDDFWELSKDCGCDCGCCNMNAYKVKQNPQYWIDKDGAYKATKELSS